VNRSINFGGAQALVVFFLLTHVSISLLHAGPDETGGVKPRVVVLPAEHSPGVKAAFAKQMKDVFAAVTPVSEERLPDFSAALTDALVGSKKYDVLERSALEAVTKELHLGHTEFADLDRAVQMGKLLNADYVLLPEIRLITASVTKSEVPFVPAMKKSINAVMSVRVRLVEVATSRLARSFSEEILHAGPGTASGGGSADQALLYAQSVYRAAAAEVVAALTKPDGQVGATESAQAKEPSNKRGEISASGEEPNR